ncbi:MAG: hypothetical protein CSA36_05205 [Draconibacterium sp.]|nr:MAG: hypothetical protein CSA36_05205 [Draconibacterium sp.]
MSFIFIVGAFFMAFSLLFFGIATISIMRFKILSLWILLLMTLGMIFDVTAIILMIKGAKDLVFSLHRLLGYTAEIAMAVSLFMVWREFARKGLNSTISSKVIRITKIAYLWWLVIYIAGSLMVIWL